jgi:hypothetical protein
MGIQPGTEREKERSRLGSGWEQPRAEEQPRHGTHPDMGTDLGMGTG